MMRGISGVDTRTDICGHQIKMPICVAPTAMQKLAHPLGELATAKGMLPQVKKFLWEFIFANEGTKTG